MKIFYISFATHNYGGALNTVDKLSSQAVNVGGVDESILYLESDIYPFLKKVKRLLKNDKVVYPRLKNSHYFVWKPHIILKTFNRIDDGDFVIYHDAGRACYNYNINRELKSFCNYVENNHKGLFVNFGIFKNINFTKRECFEVMKCYEDFYVNHNQANASWGFYQKNEFVIDFLNDWKKYCLHESLIVTDKPSKNKESSKFDAHRHDQSILTNLLLLYHKSRGYKLDPKMTDTKIKRPWGFEKNMCNAITRIEKEYGLK